MRKKWKKQLLPCYIRLRSVKIEDLLFFIESGNALYMGVSNDSAEKWTFTISIIGGKLEPHGFSFFTTVKIFPMYGCFSNHSKL